MRIHDDRYQRERLRFHVALRFIRLEARTHTIRHGTGLTDDRIRKLYRSYLADAPGRLIRRQRGKSPQCAALFLRSAPLRQQSALLASLYRLLGLLPESAGTVARPATPSLRQGELLCQAYEVYRSFIPETSLTFEHALFLQSALARAEELACGACRDCKAILVIDRWSLRIERCALCDGDHDDPPQASSAGLARAGARLQDFPNDGPGSALSSAHLVPAAPQ